MANPITTVSITRNIEYYVETTAVGYADLERVLQTRLAGEIDPDHFTSCGQECSHGAGSKGYEYC
jgi:hypothetical protein